MKKNYKQECFRVNREKNYSDHNYFSKNIEWKKSLNGRWSFSYDVEENWTTIEVPSHMELEGFGSPQYVNTMYPWDGKENLIPGDIPKRNNHFGIYEKEIEVPREWEGRPVYISFQGVESSIELYCNNVFVGYGEDSFTPNEFELTPFLKKGKNKIRAKVTKWCRGSWLEDQDFWRFSGIFRDVFLYSFPEVHIRDIFICPKVDRSLEKADLEIDLQIESSKKEKVHLEYFLIKNKKEILKNFKVIEVDKILKFKINETILNPKLWSAECPNLYELKLVLKRENGEVIENVIEKVGFRRFEIEKNILKLNGKKIVFKGINRHEFSCDKGRAITEKEMLWDIKFLKANNFNAVRCSHYPNQKRWYELCDEYGIYVIDEVNLETHGTWQILGEIRTEKVIPNNDPMWLDNILDRAKSMFNKDKNHPSILFWSCGNESFGGENLYKMSEMLRDLDPIRLVHYEGVFNDRRYDKTSDVESRMYAKVEEIERYLKETPEKPFLLCEYSHAMGNSNGNLYKYIELEKYKNYHGGFIWDYIDQSLLKIVDGKKVLVSGGDFEDRPTDYNFCTNGILFGDRKLSPKVQEIKQLFSNFNIEVKKDYFIIKNKSLFTNLTEYDVYIEVFREKEKLYFEKVNIELAPGKSKKIDLNLPKYKEEGEYVIDISIHLKKNEKFAKKGHEISFGQFSYLIKEKKEKNPNNRGIELVNGDFNIGVISNKFEVLFSKLYGGMISLKTQNKEMLEGITTPNFWRAPTDNDNGNKMQYRYAIWKIASLYRTVEEIKIESKKEYKKIVYIYNLVGKSGLKCEIEYKVYSDKIEVKESLISEEEMELPLFGMNYKFLPEFRNIEWFGLGPDETYIDRCKGGRIGVYNQEVKNQLTKYIKPQECGNHVKTRWLKLYNDNGLGIRVSSQDKFEFSALNNSVHELEEAKHIYELPKSKRVNLNINKIQMGVGGDDSWGAKTHNEFLVKLKGKMEFNYKIEIL